MAALMVAAMFWRHQPNTRMPNSASDISNVLVETAAGPWNDNVATLDARRADYLRALQFSPHAECYSKQFDKKGICAKTVQEKVYNVLRGENHVDFASIIYSQGQVEPPADVWVKIYASCPLLGPPSGDDAMLLYNSNRWLTNGLGVMGCLGGDSMNHFSDAALNGTSRDELRRPYIVQAFRRRNTSFGVIVVVAHFPHRVEYARNMRKLKHAVQEMVNSSGILNVILISDTNQPQGAAKSAQILNDIGAPVTGVVRSTGLFKSCCFPGFTITGYDRIITNFGSSMEDVYPWSKANVSSWGQRNMHLPVLGSLQLASTSGESYDEQAINQDSLHKAY